MPDFKKNTGFNMKNKGNFNFGKTMDLNVDRYGPSATQSNITFGGGSKVKDWKGDAAKKGERKSFLGRSAGKNRFGKNLG